MEQVYAITFQEESECGEYNSGLSYILKTQELAKKYLNDILEDEISNLKDSGYTKEELKIDKQDDYFTIQYGGGYVEFNISSYSILEQ